MHIWGHFKTITRHKLMVLKLCFQVGLYRQGLMHDFSKYSWTEFSKGIRYFQGNRSPNNYEREVTGLSLSWLHHKGRNRHHFEYWLDYDPHVPGNVTGMLMPRRFVAEMFCDRIAASRVYEKEEYTQASAAQFFYRSRGRYLMHDTTRRELGFLLSYLAVHGEKSGLSYIRSEYLKGSEVPESYVECEDLEQFNSMLEAGTLPL